MSLSWVDEGLEPFIEEAVRMEGWYPPMVLENIKEEPLLWQEMDSKYAGLIKRILGAFEIEYSTIPVHIHHKDIVVRGVLRYRLERGR